MYRRKRILLLSSSIILLCACLIAGATFALFTDNTRVKTHLKAGDLEATLIRNSGYRTTLDGDGLLKRHDFAPNVNFTEETPQSVNFFDFYNDANSAANNSEADGKLIVPGSEVEAIFTIRNDGTAAFVYDVQIELTGAEGDAAVALSDQLYVKLGTYTVDASGKPVYTVLSEGYMNAGTYKLSDKAGFNEQVLKGKTSQQLFAHVTFVDDRVENNDGDNENFVNNHAMDGTVAFDLVVSATQDTTRR